MQQKNNFLDKKAKKSFKIIYDDKGLSFYGTPPLPAVFSLYGC